MQRRKTFFILALAALFVLSCSLTDGATMSAAVIEPDLIASPTASPQSDPNPPTPEIPTSTPEPTRCKVTADFLNLRTCDGTSCPVLDVLEEGDLLIVLERGA